MEAQNESLSQKLLLAGKEAQHEREQCELRLQQSVRETTSLKAHHQREVAG